MEDAHETMGSTTDPSYAPIDEVEDEGDTSKPNVHERDANTQRRATGRHLHAMPGMTRSRGDAE